MKEFHILSLFPEMLQAYFDESMIGLARKNKIIQIYLHQMRSYSPDKHKNVDDKPYGGGPGMIIRADVLIPAIRDIKSKYQIDRVIYLSPKGVLLHQKKLETLNEFRSFLFVCGRYEGIDQRVIDLEIDEELSIGDYVLTGGELAAQVCIDVLTRLQQGALGDESSSEKESFQEGLLEYPHYTRPDNYLGKKVPDVLLSGNHKKIEDWRQEEALKITSQRRPDLLKKQK